MANEVAQRLGYTNREAVSGKHIAMNMSLTNAIRMGLVVNPKLVSCAYSLKTDGSLDKLTGKINQIEDIQDRNEKLKEYESLRRNVENAEGIPEILQANVKKGGKYIVFLPIVEDLEDEDGNVIGRKKGIDKIADYEKQIAEYFKGSDIIPNFHSMLGKYGDKENSRRLEEFQNANTEETEFMLVMNKANEGLHLDKLDGMIWLRPMDENSKILYLQQLGRVIYAEDPDNPTKDEDRPVVIDLVNNTLKVNWENEITEQDDIQMLNIILDWSERHNGTLPDINSSDKEETGYATVLKEIQNKYKEYLKNEFEGVNEKQIEEVQEIVRLGSTIDLWQINLPERNKRDGESKGRSFSDEKVGLFEVTGLLKDFVELEDSVDSKIITKNLQEQIIEFIENNSSHKIPRGQTRKSRKRADMSETEIYEVNLRQRWNRSKEKEILEEYAGRSIEEVPEEYREFVSKMREYGYGLANKKTLQEQIIEFVENSDTNSLPSSANKGDESNLYARWFRSKEKEILEEYAGRSIDEVPEEYREFVSKMREYGYGIENKKTLQEQIIEFVENSDTNSLPSSVNRGTESNLYARWRPSKEKEILEEYAGRSIDEVPEEYRRFISKMREYGYGLEKKKTLQEQMIEFVENSDTNSLPSATNKGDESKLYQRWNRSKEKETLEEYAGRTIEEVPEKYRKFVSKMREYGYGLEKKKTLQEQMIEFIENSNTNSLPKTAKEDNGKNKQAKKMTEEEKYETRLYEKWIRSKERKILEKYAGREIEEVPEEYREFVKKMREYGYGLDKNKKRTSKEIAQASISSLTDIEMSDREDAALKELVEKTKEGGMNLDEQS